jgi:hypothetical protein
MSKGLGVYIQVVHENLGIDWLMGDKPVIVNLPNRPCGDLFIIMAIDAKPVNTPLYVPDVLKNVFEAIVSLEVIQVGIYPLPLLKVILQSLNLFFDKSLFLVANGRLDTNTYFFQFVGNMIDKGPYLG